LLALVFRFLSRFLFIRFLLFAQSLLPLQFALVSLSLNVRGIVLVRLIPSLLLTSSRFVADILAANFPNGL
jgi:hypothetical protein